MASEQRDAEAELSSTSDGRLDRDECLRLLAANDVGRVVYTERALPAVEVVAYGLDEREVLFRTGRVSPLAAVRDTVVGFQVDEIAADTRTGWSVLVVGGAYEVTDGTRHGRLSAGSPANPDTCTIAVQLQQVSGRKVVLPVSE